MKLKFIGFKDNNNWNITNSYFMLKYDRVNAYYYYFFILKLIVGLFIDMNYKIYILEHNFFNLL
jgi:hypothetical protein